MIQEVLQEETGGKDLSIIKITLAKGYASKGKLEDSLAVWFIFCYVEELYCSENVVDG